MVNKKIVIICTILAIIVVGGIVGVGIWQINNDNDYDTQNVEEDINQEENTDAENNEDDNTVSDEASDGSEDEENTLTESDSTENLTDETVSQTTETPEDIAKRLAKEEWGEEDDTVYYYVEEQLSDNVYVVSVRSKDTTATQIDYEINIETGDISEY